MVIMNLRITVLINEKKSEDTEMNNKSKYVNNTIKTKTYALASGRVLHIYIYIYFSQPVTHFINEYNWRICEQHKEKEKERKI